MEVGNKKAKYAIPVYTRAYASKFAGTVYCDSKEEYNNLLDENCDDLFEDGYISTNCTNDFEIGDVEIEDFNFVEESKHYENK